MRMKLTTSSMLDWIYDVYLHNKYILCDLDIIIKGAITYFKQTFDFNNWGLCNQIYNGLLIVVKSWLMCLMDKFHITNYSLESSHFRPPPQSPWNFHLNDNHVRQAVSLDETVTKMEANRTGIKWNLSFCVFLCTLTSSGAYAPLLKRELSTLGAQRSGHENGPGRQVKDRVGPSPSSPAKGGRPRSRPGPHLGDSGTAQVPDRANRGRARSARII